MFLLVIVVIELLGLRMDLDFRELNALHLKVKIAQPIIKVLLVLILKPPKFIELQVHASK
jgi:hypothetical protein